jgi:peptidoglycan lytic transglycosylase F
MFHSGARPVSVTLATLLVACSGSRAPEGGAASDTTPSGYVERGDIDAIERRGRIRFANVARANIEELPRLRWGAPSEDALAREFADRLRLELDVAQYPDEQAAIDALRAGLVDGIVGRKGPEVAPPPDGVLFSTAFRTEPGVIVGRRDRAPRSIAELSGRTVSFALTSPMIGHGPELVRANSSVTIDTIDALTAEDVIDRIMSGEIDLTLAERWVAEAVASQFPDIEIGTEFGEITYTAAVRSSNPELLRLVNDFAFQILPVGVDAPPFLGDLPEIEERRVLRVLTVNGPSSYFVYKGDLVGFDLEFMRMFANEQNLIMQMVVAPSVDDLLPWLERGIGDVVGAGIVPLQSHDGLDIRFTREYHDVDPVLIAREDLGLDPDSDLTGLTVVAARNNPYLSTIEERADSRGYEVLVTPDAESTGQMLDRLEGGEADLTLLESHLADLEMPGREGLEVVLRDDATPGRSWAVRADQLELLEALEDFLEREVGQLTYAVLIRKYFRPETRRVVQPDLQTDGSLSPWDDLTRQYADESDFDWRLITAQMFQESRFDPRARSHAGAYGLMQLMPATAQQMGVQDIEDPGQQIQAGVRYLRWLHDRFGSEDLDLADRQAFALAAYNAGYGHVGDARRVAELTGLDPDRWIDNVERSMLSLSDPDVYNFTRYGYVRGQEPVHYVRRINELGLMYFRLVPN